MLKITAILGLILVICSCNKTVEEYNPNFIGKWFSEAKFDPIFNVYISNELTFTDDQVKYQRDCRDTCATDLCECLNTIEGKAEINSSKTLFRIRNQNQLTLAINIEPYQENGVWKMEIDGKKYIKQ